MEISQYIRLATTYSAPSYHTHNVSGHKVTDYFCRAVTKIEHNLTLFGHFPKIRHFRFESN